MVIFINIRGGKGMYKLSELSKSRLVGVDPKLVLVVNRAIELTKIDFRVQEGLRTLETQQQYFKKGVTQTLNSKHITGDAVDLVAIVQGKVSWDEKYYIDIAEAVRLAAIELNIPVRWGGCWLSDLRNYKSAQDALDKYKSVRKSQGRKVFLDLVHFELM